MLSREAREALALIAADSGQDAPARIDAAGQLAADDAAPAEAEAAAAAAAAAEAEAAAAGAQP